MPGLPEKAKAEGLTPLEYMRRYGAFEVARNVGAQHEAAVPEGELEDVRVSPRGRVYTRAEKPPSPNVVPVPSPDPDAEGRRPVGVEVDGGRRARLPDAERAARVLLLDARGAGAGPSTRCRPTSGATSTRGASRRARCRSSRPSACRCRSTPAAPTPSGSTRSRTRTRSGSTRRTPRRSAVATGDLVRVETRIGHFVVKAWVTEGIRPGVVACSHHMGRWKTRRPGPAPDDGDGQPDARGHRAGGCGARRTSRPSRPPTPTPRASGGPTPASTRT